MSNFTRIPGDKKRRYVNIVTGETISRRQYDNIRGIKRVPQVKMQRYLNIRNSYILKKAHEGKKVTRREAMNSKELKKVIKDLNKGKKLIEKGDVIKAKKYLKRGLIKIKSKEAVEIILDKYIGDTNDTTEQ